MKKRYRLTESALRDMIREAVEDALMEDMDDIKNRATSMAKKASNGMNKMGKGMKNAGNNIRNRAASMAKGAANGMNKVGKGMKNAWGHWSNDVDNLTRDDRVDNPMHKDYR